MKASAEFGGHPLALVLLGNYLYAAFADHEVRHRAEVDLLAETEGSYLDLKPNWAASDTL
jgi:hypothetical protein